jgi:protein-tyrosine kinase
MSIIEQATRRLEELRRAGVEVAWEAPPPPAAPEPLRPSPLLEPLHPAPASINAHTGSARTRAERTAASGTALVRVGLRQSRSVELDLAQLASEGYLVPGAPRSVLADEFRGIKQPVLKNARGESGQAPGQPTPSGQLTPSGRPNLIMVTSALPGEGKTFCALNLALSIASEVDSSVLLVDADVVRPAVMSRLGLAGQYKGLLDLLADTQLELPDLILKTNVPKLSVLPAGAPSIHSTELLTSDAMQELLADIATRYADRIVIFDAPPLLSTTESRVLAARMGQILMVVAQGQTQQTELAQALIALEQCPLVMCVLNRSLNDSDHLHYGYYAA